MNITAMGRFTEFVPQEMVEELTQRAVEAQKNSYSPYSHYPVGAAILMESGKIFTGCNVENALLGATICAERSAIVSAVASGEREIKAVVIVLGEGGAPCGPCRQFINEFNPHAYIYSATSDGVIHNEWRLDELLPNSFGPKDLKHLA
ncbi:MAG: Cytidine deaminase [Chlamydiae bacterium]|nr:Cytidine deaminase [Chlamydiota bacterium]